MDIHKVQFKRVFRFHSQRLNAKETTSRECVRECNDAGRAYELLRVARQRTSAGTQPVP